MRPPDQAAPIESHRAGRDRRRPAGGGDRQVVPGDELLGRPWVRFRDAVGTSGPPAKTHRGLYRRNLGCAVSSPGFRKSEIPNPKFPNPQIPKSGSSQIRQGRPLLRHQWLPVFAGDRPQASPRPAARRRKYTRPWCCKTSIGKRPKDFLPDTTGKNWKGLMTLRSFGATAPERASALRSR